MNNTRSIFYFDHTKIKFCAEKNRKNSRSLLHKEKLFFLGQIGKKLNREILFLGVHTMFFFIFKKILKVIFEPVRSWYGDGEKFNSDWTYTKSYGGPHLARDKLLVYL